MEQINYSFIIPHKNCPNLLKRCVGSIPERDDVQVIVVDDNSDEGKKPIINRKNVEVIHLDANQSKGAGRARNVGLKHARGKWLLFADADDYYVDNFLDVLDNKGNSDADVIYFNVAYLNRMGKEVKGGSRWNKIIENYCIDKESIDLIKYRIHVPWNKMVKREYVKTYGFSFEEVPNGNDAMFSYQIGYFSNKIEVVHNKLYVYTINTHSITHSHCTVKSQTSYLSNKMKQMQFYKYIGRQNWCEEISLNRYVISLLKRLQIYSIIVVLYTYYTKREYFNSIKMKYVETMDNIIRNSN